MLSLWFLDGFSMVSLPFRYGFLMVSICVLFVLVMVSIWFLYVLSLVSSWLLFGFSTVSWFLYGFFMVSSMIYLCFLDGFHYESIMNPLRIHYISPDELVGSRRTNLTGYELVERDLAGSRRTNLTGYELVAGRIRQVRIEAAQRSAPLRDRLRDRPPAAVARSAQGWFLS